MMPNTNHFTAPTPSSKKLPLWLNLVALCFFVVFLSLASWQANRGLEKQKMLNSIHTIRTVLSNQQLSSSEQTYHTGQEVSLTGELDNEHVFLLENKMMQGRVGFIVIQPLLLDNDFQILINRGWIPKVNNTELTTLVAPIYKTVTIRGQLYMPKHNVFITKNIIKHEWPQKALEIDVAAFEQRLNKKVFPMVVNLHNDSESSFIGPEPLGEGFSPERHFGYMVQWLLFAAILFGIWGYFQWRLWRKK